MKVSITFCIASLLLLLIMNYDHHVLLPSVSFDVTALTANLIHVQMYNM